MKSRISAVVALGAVCALGAFAWVGCSEPEKKPPSTKGCTVSDPLNPPVTCGPEEGGAVVCNSTANVDKCPAGECMAQAEQTGPVKNFRMGRIRLWAPEALLSLVGIAVDPNVNAKCANNGAEAFTWLVQVDETAKQLKTGGARGSTDGKTFSFLNESVDASKLESVCPGFKGPDMPVGLQPVNVKYTVTNGAIATETIPLINVPIFDTSGIPIILPLRQAQLKDMTVKGSCIGKWEKKYWCDGDSLGWTTGGTVIAKITTEDADRVPVKSLSCRSLCAILSGAPGNTCARGADGKIPQIGTHCASGEGCKDAFLLSATFGAYGVDITAGGPAGDAGTDAVTDAPADGG